MAEKILVVDDDLDTLRLVGMMLERQGYTIVAASNGNQAIGMAQSEQPDLILLDVMMPDIDGVEVTRRLRSNELTKDVPIIMFTAKTQVEDKILGFEAGADDYLTKPTQPRELFAHVKAVLTRTGKARPAVPSTQTAAQANERGRVIGILSVRGELGVSTLSLNLGVALHETYNKDVVVSEYRPGKGTISLELGYLRPDGLVHLLQKKPSEIDVSSVEAELTSHTAGLRLLLASPQPRDAKYINNVENFEVITQQLTYLGKYIVIDLGTSLTPLVEKVIPLCDTIIIVVEPVPQTLAQTKSLLDDLNSMGIGSGKISVVVVNRIRTGMQLSWSQVQEQLGRNISVIFTPAPELAYQASTNNTPMILQQPESLTAQQFTKLAELVAQRR